MYHTVDSTTAGMEESVHHCFGIIMSMMFGQARGAAKRFTGGFMTNDFPRKDYGYVSMVEFGVI